MGSDSFYTTFIKFDDVFFGFLVFVGCAVVLLRMRKNGLLATLVALGGFVCMGLSTLYWLLQDFELITATNKYVWAGGRLLFDFGVLLLVVAFALPRIGAVGATPSASAQPWAAGSVTPPATTGYLQPGAPYAQPGQPGAPYAQPGQPSAPYAQPGQPAYGQPAPQPGWPAPGTQQQGPAFPQVPPQQ
ncbi:MAG: hypothetical protein HOV79_24790 [Hamadaea sp.]|nr:hypothetical protein [Hamadaea sp.]